MKLSILLRNLNEGSFLQQFLQSLNRQEIRDAYEVIVVDNESDDNSLEIIQQFGCRLITVPRKEFTYGSALNTGIKACKGEYIFIASPHVCLRNNDFLQKTIHYLDSDTKAAGLRFILPGHTIIAKHAYDKEYNVLQWDASPDFFQKNNTHFIINHCSAIRKKCWELLPFDPFIDICEDKKWSLQILQKGYHILYNVPLFYTYEKALHGEEKHVKFARELAANEIISGSKNVLYKATYPSALYNLLKIEMWRLKRSIKEHRFLYKKIKQLRQQS